MNVQSLARSVRLHGDEATVGGGGRLFASKLRHVSRAYLVQRQLRRRYGIPVPGVMGSVMGRSGLNVVYTTRQFQPCAESFDERYRFVGPMMSRSEDDTFAWEALGDAPVVYISLGTLFNTDVSFYRRCFEAFGRWPGRVVLSIGSQVDRASLGVVPANFVVADQVPQLAVLRRTTVFVTHGGMNSVSESLASGVPVVVVPQMSEQAIVGRRVEELGAGICLTRSGASAEALLGAVQRVLRDARFGRAVAALRDSFLGAGGVTEAADAIVAYTRGPGDALPR